MSAVSGQRPPTHVCAAVLRVRAVNASLEMCQEGCCFSRKLTCQEQRPTSGAHQGGDGQQQGGDGSSDALHIHPLLLIAAGRRPAGDHRCCRPSRASGATGRAAAGLLIHQRLPLDRLRHLLSAKHAPTSAPPCVRAPHAAERNNAWCCGIMRREMGRIQARPGLTAAETEPFLLTSWPQTDDCIRRPRLPRGALAALDAPCEMERQQRA